MDRASPDHTDPGDLVGWWSVRGHLEASNRPLRRFLVILILVVVICVPKRLDLGGDWILRSAEALVSK